MGSGACFLDYDNDGWQDILLINSMDWPGHQTGKSYPALYHNNQNGTFTDVTRQADSRWKSTARAAPWATMTTTAEWTSTSLRSDRTIFSATSATANLRT